MNRTPKNLEGKIRFEISDPDQPQEVLSLVETLLTVPANGEAVLEKEIPCPGATPWSLESPKLYRLKAVSEFNLSYSEEGPVRKLADLRRINFGFRWFEADGVGENAVLRLNGQRIRLISAISWGFWGLNGLWPTPELAEREVYAAQTFGMNCINFHRNIGKTEVLDVQDRYGLLRYMEPGGGQTAFGEAFTLYASSPDTAIDTSGKEGDPQTFAEKDTSGKEGDPQTFAEKYMEEKIIRMIRDQRSHPSLVMYCIQNEIHPDLRNPRIFRVLRRMHAEDPSRIVALKSGIPPRNQAWMQPYENTVYFDRVTAETAIPAVGISTPWAVPGCGRMRCIRIRQILPIARRMIAKLWSGEKCSALPLLTIIPRYCERSGNRAARATICKIIRNF
jgi:hypothetical protein